MTIALPQTVPPVHLGGKPCTTDLKGIDLKGAPRFFKTGRALQSPANHGAH